MTNSAVFFSREDLWKVLPRSQGCSETCRLLLLRYAEHRDDTSALLSRITAYPYLAAVDDNVGFKSRVGCGGLRSYLG
jgi:hypothetical protein